MMTAADSIAKELADVKAGYSNVEGATLEACVPAMVRVRIVRNEQKQLVACFIFPEAYPNEPVVVELKSKTMSFKLIDGLTKICEEEARKSVGGLQIVSILMFIRKFIDENPLCVCSEEISAIKRSLTSNDEIKLKQKTSQVTVKLKEEEYFVALRLTIPDDYPKVQTRVELSDTNFPDILKANIESQAVEISRQCVQPPLKRNPKAPPFVPRPALQPVIEYARAVIRRYPHEMCPLCDEPSLPKDPKQVSNNPKCERFIERVYCKHLFHHSCLDLHMKTPPFIGGKKCPACGLRIYHEKWKVTPELAEARWAHKEARRRELDEVVDFLKE